MFGYLRYFSFLFLIVGFFLVSAPLAAEETESAAESSAIEPIPPDTSTSGPAVEPVPVPPPKKKDSRGAEKRKYMIPDPERVDAGIFHVAMAIGGNFYIEPELQNGALSGNYLKDFGFQAGVYFDYDYSELPQNIPLMLRGMVGYKYILGSTHVFTFDGMVRHMFNFSEKASFGLGIGGSAAVWYRVESQTPPTSNEEIIFLPSLILGAGFEFNPFMVDFKWLINRFGEDSSITGFELYFGFRL